MGACFFCKYKTYRLFRRMIGVRSIHSFFANDEKSVINCIFTAEIMKSQQRKSYGNKKDF